MEQKIGGSSWVANIKSQVMENLANTKSHITQNLANTESRVTKSFANTENQVLHDSGGWKLEEGKGVAPSKRLAPRWWPSGISKT
jgi:hypothetical protein